MPFEPVDPRQSFPELEERVLERWRERDIFNRSLANREGAEVWSFYEGPPTANGRPGSHHVLSRVFKDVYPRYRTMRGYRVPRKAGWDCHGLPVELEVEKELGISSKQEIEEYGIAEFNQRCRESVFEYVEEWNRLTERIGFWIDLHDPYVTLENEYIESVWWSLRKLWDDERLYEGHKVVPYCPRCGTALSSHEVAQGYKDVEDPSIYVRLPLLAEDGGEVGESLLVWTTTPWTLPGNVAVAAAPGVTYVKARVEGETLILAQPPVERVLGGGGGGGGAGVCWAGSPGSSGCWGRGRRSSSGSAAGIWWAAPTAVPSSRSRTAAPPTPSASSPASSSPPRTAPASSTSPPPSASTTTPSRPRTGYSTRPAPAPPTTRLGSAA